MDPLLSQENYLNRFGSFGKQIHVLWLVCKGIFVLLQAFDSNHSFLSFFNIIIRFFGCHSFLFIMVSFFSLFAGLSLVAGALSAPVGVLKSPRSATPSSTATQEK